METDKGRSRVEVNALYIYYSRRVLWLCISQIGENCIIMNLHRDPSS